MQLSFGDRLVLRSFSYTCDNFAFDALVEPGLLRVSHRHKVMISTCFQKLSSNFLTNSHRDCIPISMQLGSNLVKPHLLLMGTVVTENRIHVFKALVPSFGDNEQGEEESQQAERSEEYVSVVRQLSVPRGH